MGLFTNTYSFLPVVHGAMDCGQKLSVSVAVPPAPIRVPSQRPHAPSVASVTSVANDKGFLPLRQYRIPGLFKGTQTKLLSYIYSPQQ